MKLLYVVVNIQIFWEKIHGQILQDLNVMWCNQHMFVWKTYLIYCVGEMENISMYSNVILQHDRIGYGYFLNELQVPKIWYANIKIKENSYEICDIFNYYIVAIPGPRPIVVLITYFYTSDWCIFSHVKKNTLHSTTTTTVNSIPYQILY